MGERRPISEPHRAAQHVKDALLVCSRLCKDLRQFLQLASRSRSERHCLLVMEGAQNQPSATYGNYQNRPASIRSREFLREEVATTNGASDSSFISSDRSCACSSSRLSLLAPAIRILEPWRQGCKGTTPFPSMMVPYESTSVQAPHQQKGGEVQLRWSTSPHGFPTLFRCLSRARAAHDHCARGDRPHTTGCSASDSTVLIISRSQGYGDLSRGRRFLLQ